MEFNINVEEIIKLEKHFITPNETSDSDINYQFINILCERLIWILTWSNEVVTN